MEDLTLALITLTSFVLLFVVAIFADRAGTELDQGTDQHPVRIPLNDGAMHATPDADVA